jgi:2-hydroxychromene-2-carboxylate isomerase
MARIEFFFDIASPYTYMASTQIDALAERTGAELIWRPFLLGGVFKSVGNQPPAMLLPRGRYMFQDLQRWSAKYDVPISMPSVFPPNTLVTQRVLAAAYRKHGHDPMRRLAKRLFHVYWVEDAKIWEPAVLVKEAVAAGCAGQELLAMAVDPQIKGLLRDWTDEAVERGAFGAPTFFVGDEMVFGNDRLHFVEELATQSD